VRRSERDILEAAVKAVAEQATAASAIVDEAHNAGLDGSHPVTLQAKLLRLELLNVKADLERELGRLVLHCTDCGRTVHWVAGLSAQPGLGRIGTRHRTAHQSSRSSLGWSAGLHLRRRFEARDSPHMTVYPRLWMRLELPAYERPTDNRLRPVGRADAPELARVLLAASRGTVDDEGESEEDARAVVYNTLAGQEGPFVDACSFVAVEGGRLIGASLITLFEGRPLLSYVVVDPAMQRRGVGSLLIRASGNALVAAGHRELDLFVTEANRPAVRLYEKLGFRVLERVHAPAEGK
jgi:ribosomal protein S18 acetylase RimI-like enzyme